MIKFKKSQSEIIGMLMIVVIISFLLLFVVKAILGDKDNGALDKAKGEDEATATINALLKTTNHCTPGEDFADLILECSRVNNGASSEIVCSDESDVCTFAKAKIKVIFDSYFSSRNRPYEFRVGMANGGNFENLQIKSYSGEDEQLVREGRIGVQVGTQTLPLGYGYSGKDIEIKLCLGGPC